MWHTQSVIFIFEHSESGSAGLILNKPTEHTIGSIDGLESLCPEFAENCLFMVGPCSVRAVLMFRSVLLFSVDASSTTGVCQTTLFCCLSK